MSVLKARESRLRKPVTHPGHTASRGSSPFSSTSPREPEHAYLFLSVSLILEVQPKG